MKLDVLVFAAHPDDAELGCGGTIASLVSEGKKVGIVDLTGGELGTRGTVESRAIEAAESAKVLGLSARENLNLGDGFFEINEVTIIALVKMIRKYQPETILANAPEDRHPDHGRGGALQLRAAFLSGLLKIETELNGVNQEPWRATNFYHYIQDRYLTPDFVVDITPFFEQKIEAVKAFKSQFNSSDSDEPQTYISSPEFWCFIKARAQEMGHSAGFSYGEGFLKSKQIGLKSLSTLTGQA
jgi:bacillithiol biosynthesis deacetylase BshB1